MRVLSALVLGLFVVQAAENETMNDLAERYVKLVLALGQHDADYVDAYYGPAGWKTEVEQTKRPLADIGRDAAAVDAALATVKPAAQAEEAVRLRHEYLTRQLSALRARVSMLEGKRFTFDEESRALYDAVAPTHTESEFDAVLAELDSRLPGPGSLSERVDKFRSQFVIPRDRLDATFKAAIDACRSRTLAHLSLPHEESFTVEYVTNKSWSGYNWYQGNYRSLIQVNTDLPIFVDRAIDLACHEGYPGHHVYNVLLEKSLVRDRGWVEFSVYPLRSPQSLIAEGSANYGIDIAFPRPERMELERKVIFPSAGLDPTGVDTYYAVLSLTDRLSYAGNEAARRYLNGQVDAAAAARWLERYGLYSAPRAQQRIRFIDQYRSYVINYNLGKDMVARYIEAESGGASDAGRRWDVFTRLLSSPRLPSGLAR
ncbi:MAG TPA: hypothetical protein VFS23_29365 [Vicinamibacterales bacterium]|nr:hypothetical protein [Vicinamibacterales bacterium]